jgi:hypothetical protein
MNGGADVGFVRTGILEEWISSQYLKAQDIYWSGYTISYKD